MSEYTTCPIWGTLASIEPLTSDGVTVDSPRAGGRYLITGRATETLKSHDENLKSRLTSWLIEQHRLGVDCPEISPTNVDEIEQRRSLSIHQTALSEEIHRSEFSTDDKELGGSEFTPLGWEHINLTGDYNWRQNKQVEPGDFRPLPPLNRP